MFWVFFFFFSSRRRHTRSLCDWSSDVCSSDLEVLHAVRDHPRPGQELIGTWVVANRMEDLSDLFKSEGWTAQFRSEERRVGKECRSRWCPEHGKKKIEAARICRVRQQRRR